MSNSNISAKKMKFIQSLHQKKYRQEHQAFLVEGAKNVLELLEADFEIMDLFVTENFAEKNEQALWKCKAEWRFCNEEIITRVGTLQTNDAALAVVQAKPNTLLLPDDNEWVLALDQVRDPGNLGTILRIADWYGIRKVICSEQTAEIYNPKVIAATMGSFTRVQTYYCELAAYLKEYRSENQRVLGAFLGGEDVHTVAFSAAGGFLVMGNESHGISPEVGAQVQQAISIPQYGGAESLNVAIATAVICDNIRRVVGS